MVGANRWGKEGRMCSPWLVSSDLTGNCNFTPVIAEKRCFLDSSPYAIHLVFSFAKGKAQVSSSAVRRNARPLRYSGILGLVIFRGDGGGPGRRVSERWHRSWGACKVESARWDWAASRLRKLGNYSSAPASPRCLPHLPFSSLLVRGLCLAAYCFITSTTFPSSFTAAFRSVPGPNYRFFFLAQTCRGHLGKRVPGVGPAGSYHGQPSKEAAQDVEAVRVRRWVRLPSAASFVGG